MRMNCLFSLIAILAVLVWISGCDNDYPPSVYDPDVEGLPTPVVNSIVPLDSSWTGVGVITIQGSNFSDELERNVVYFNSDMSTIIEASPTQLVLQSPLTVGDTINVRVAVIGAYLYSNIINYKLKPTVQKWGTFMDDDFMYALAVDTEENVFVSIAKSMMKKVDIDGNTSQFCATGFLKASYMTFGPDSNLYASVEAGRVKKIAKFDSKGNESVFASLAGKPSGLDFDSDGNIWVAAEKEIYRIDPNGAIENKATMTVDLMYLQVYDNTLYVSYIDENAGENKILGMPINIDGSLGTEEVVFDAAADYWDNDVEVLSFIFDDSGLMYLGTNANTNPVRVYDLNTNTVEELFDGLISSGDVYDLVWGSKNFFYAVQQYFDNSGIVTGTKIIKIDVEAKSVM